MSVTVYLKSDQTLHVAITNEDDEPVISGTVTMSITDRGGNAIGSDMTLTYGSGTYNTPIPYDLFAKADRYDAWVTLVDGDYHDYGKFTISTTYKAI